MNLSPEHFVGSRKLEVHGVVRGSQAEGIKIDLEAILERHVRGRRLTLYKTVTEMNVAPPLGPFDGPVLSIAGWPRRFTPDFTPQDFLHKNRRELDRASRLAWQLCLIDPDSRLLIRTEGPNTVHHPFEASDFPVLATTHGCSVLLSGGAECRATRLNSFVEALLSGQLPQLPSDWHFMPPLP